MPKQSPEDFMKKEIFKEFNAKEYWDKLNHGDFNTNHTTEWNWYKPLISVEQSCGCLILSYRHLWEETSNSFSAKCIPCMHKEILRQQKQKSFEKKKNMENLLQLEMLAVKKLQLEYEIKASLGVKPKFKIKRLNS